MDNQDSTPPDGPSDSSSGPSKEELKKAMRAFKKRLKMMRLDDESRLGRGAMSGGVESGVVAIVPPNQFPPEIWDELVRQGRLKSAGHGMYELDGA